MNPHLMTVLICITLLMVLSRIRIVRVPKPLSDIDKHTGNGENAELVITGYMDKLREVYVDKTDIEILNKSHEDFHSIFDEAVRVYMEDKVKVDDILNVQVFFDWTDKNLLVSKATAKTKDGEKIIEYMNLALSKAKKQFS